MTISEAYLLGRKDEKERPTPLCNNPRSICVRCTEQLKCPDADTGAYIDNCKDFNLTPIAPYISTSNVNVPFQIARGGKQMTIDIDQNELIGIIAEKLNVDKSNIMIIIHKNYRNGLEHYAASAHVDTNKSYDDDDYEQCVVNN